MGKDIKDIKDIEFSESTVEIEEDGDFTITFTATEKD